jgi:hypothetical protein
MTAPTAPVRAAAGTRLPEPPVWPGRAPVRGWLRDLLLGARLARGGNRSGRLRVALTAVGIGVAVTLLLTAAAIPHIRAAQLHRQDATTYEPIGPIPGVDPLYLRQDVEPYDGSAITVGYVRAGGPRAPLPPGLARLPGPGEQIVSPALQRLMAAKEAVRDRYPARVIGTVGPPGLPGGPGELIAWIGSADVTSVPVYVFGTLFPSSEPLPPLLWALVLVGLVVLLFPMFVLVSAVSRLSAADRRRRLAAIRLVGAGAPQTRRIAAGEVLAGAVVGLLAGTALFLGARAGIESDALRGVSLFGGVRPFTADVVPSWPLVVLIAVGVPGLAVLTAVFALRQTVIEPLDVLRQAVPERRRLLWRLLPAAAGVALLLSADGDRVGPDGATGPGPVLVTGTALVLLSVPLLLPWLVRQIVRRPRDETPALQLAARRLQLDGGPAARLAAGVGVALAGAIGLSALLGAAQSRFDLVGAGPPVDRAMVLLVPPVDPAGLAGTLRAVPGVTTAHQLQRLPLTDDQGSQFSALVAPCPVLRTLAPLRSCVDGQIYGSPGFDLGRAAQVAGPDGQPTRYRLPLPARLEPIGSSYGPLYATPAAVRSVPAATLLPQVSLTFDAGDPGAVDRVRAALAPIGWHAALQTERGFSDPGENAGDFATIRRALFAGTLLTLTLAAVALLVLCLQQVRDGRRALAALAAIGVPRSVLARSLLWQNAILALPALLLADGVGIALGALLLPAVGNPATVDWPAVATLTAAAVGTVTVTTALVLPAIRTATGPAGLRTE